MPPKSPTRWYNAQRTVLQSYLPVLVFLGLGIAIGAAFTTLNRVLGPSKPSQTKAQANMLACFMSALPIASETRLVG